ncbi:hypothetical protein P4S68_14465 [Pseudoalteromonas sp. Hal099]
MPEQYRDVGKNQAGSLVKFKSDLVGEQTWQGQIIRTEGALSMKVHSNCILLRK